MPKLFLFQEKTVKTELLIVLNKKIDEIQKLVIDEIFH